MAWKNNKTALKCAADLLSRQEQSEAHLRQKLELRKYSQTDIDNAIEKLKNLNYLNDKRACENQFEIWYQSKKYSVQQICFKLIKLGFERQLVESLVPTDTYEHDKLVAKNMLQIKFKTLPDEKKIFNFLQTKGFDNCVMYDAVREYKSSFADEI